MVEVSCDGLCSRLRDTSTSSGGVVGMERQLDSWFVSTMHKDRKVEYQTSMITRNSSTFVIDLLKGM